MLKIEKKYWNNGYNLVAGIDEAGRGPLAGPVVAACVVFHKEDPLLCHKIEMWPMLHEFPSKEIRCPYEQKAI